MGNQYGGVFIRTDQAYYTAGDQVTGNHYSECYHFENIWYNQSELGIEECSWLQNQDQDNAKSIQGKNIIYNHKFNIFENQDVMIKSGGYIFPFSFQLDQQLPGTFQQNTLEYKAKISYQISVQCITSINLNSFKNQQELVIRQQNGNQETTYCQMTIIPRTFFFLKQGRCKIRAFFQKNAYLPGEDALILCQIDNLYCNLDIDKIDCILYKCVNLVSDQGIQKSIKVEVNQARLLDIESGRIFKGDFAKRRLMKIYNKYQQKVLPPSTNGKLITCKYILEISCILLGCLCGQQLPLCSTKIQLISPPVKFDQLNDPQNWEPKIFEERKIFLTRYQQVTPNPLLNIMRTESSRQKLN